MNVDWKQPQRYGRGLTDEGYIIDDQSMMSLTLAVVSYIIINQSMNINQPSKREEHVDVNHR